MNMRMSGNMIIKVIMIINLFGALKGSVKIEGDIISSLNESWEADYRSDN